MHRYSRVHSFRVTYIESCMLWWKECSMVSEPHREVVRKAVSLKTLAIFHQSIADLNFKRVNFFKYINFQSISTTYLSPLARNLNSLKKKRKTYAWIPPKTPETATTFVPIPLPVYCEKNEKTRAKTLEWIIRGIKQRGEGKQRKLANKRKN